MLVETWSLSQLWIGDHHLRRNHGGKGGKVSSKPRGILLATILCKITCSQRILAVTGSHRCHLTAFTNSFLASKAVLAETLAFGKLIHSCLVWFGLSSIWPDYSHQAFPLVGCLTLFRSADGVTYIGVLKQHSETPVMLMRSQRRHELYFMSWLF